MFSPGQTSKLNRTTNHAEATTTPYSQARRASPVRTPTVHASHLRQQCRNRPPHSAPWRPTPQPAPVEARFGNPRRGLYELPSMCSSDTRVLDHPDRVSYRPPPLVGANFLSPSIPHTSSKSALPVLDFRQSAQSRPICSGPGDVPYAGEPTFGTPLWLRSGRLTQSNSSSKIGACSLPVNGTSAIPGRRTRTTAVKGPYVIVGNLKRLELGDDPLAEYPDLLSQIG